MSTNTSPSQECCPEFKPENWDPTTRQWHNESFIRGTYPSFLHIPLPGTVAKTITKLWQQAENEHVAPEKSDFLMLANDPSPWKGEFLLKVKSPLKNADNVSLTGEFETKVFDGPYQKVPKFIQQMDQELKDKGKQAIKYYFYYTTCPKCAKKYGHNYMVAFAQTAS